MWAKKIFPSPDHYVNIVNNNKKILTFNTQLELAGFPGQSRHYSISYIKWASIFFFFFKLLQLQRRQWVLLFSPFLLMNIFNRSNANKKKTLRLSNWVPSIIKRNEGGHIVISIGQTFETDGPTHLPHRFSSVTSAPMTPKIVCR